MIGFVEVSTVKISCFACDKPTDQVYKIKHGCGDTRCSCKVFACNSDCAQRAEDKLLGLYHEKK